jgi:hypothetical protein
MNDKKYGYDPLSSADADVEASSLRSGSTSHPRRQVRQASYHYIIYSILIISNIVAIGLYWNTRQSAQQCLTPKMMYCMVTDIPSWLQKAAHPMAHFTN